MNQEILHKKFDKKEKNSNEKLYFRINKNIKLFSHNKFITFNICWVYSVHENVNVYIVYIVYKLLK